MSVRDQTRNIEAFRIGGKEVNEFEFHKNQGEMTEQNQPPNPESTQLTLETRAEHVAGVMEAAHQKAEKRKRRISAKARTKSAAIRSMKKASVKRGAKKTSSGQASAHGRSSAKITAVRRGSKKSALARRAKVSLRSGAKSTAAKRGGKKRPRSTSKRK